MEEHIFVTAKKFLNVSLKDHQLQTLLSYCKGKDTVFIVPTGYGKSLIYQLAPFILDIQRYRSSSISDASVFSNTSSVESTTHKRTLRLTSTPLRPTVADVSKSFSELDLSSSSSSVQQKSSSTTTSSSTTAASAVATQVYIFLL